MANFFGKLFKKKDGASSHSSLSLSGTGSGTSPSPSPSASATATPGSGPGSRSSSQQVQKRFDAVGEDDAGSTTPNDQQRASASNSASNSKNSNSNSNSTPESTKGQKRSSKSPQQSPQPPQSEFARSAHEAARRGLKAPGPAREIDENTALSSLTDAEIVRLMEGMEGDVLRQPLITGPVPLLAIKKEYLRGSPQVLRKLEWLEENGWDQVWRARGDGDCFYRSFTLAFLLRILYAPDPSGDAAQALTNVHATLPSMELSGFQTDLLDEFLEPLLSVIAAFVDPPPGQEPTEYSLLQVLQNPEKSNCIVVALRLMTGAYIRTHPDDFAPFLFSPVTLEPVTPDTFCAQEVEPCGREADNAQIMALAAALKMPIRVAYLDRSEAGSGVINWVEFENAEEANRPLTLLYRPGHFDVVAKDKLQAQLVQSQKDEANVAAARDKEAQVAAVRADASKIFAPVSGPSRSQEAAAGPEVAPPVGGGSVVVPERRPAPLSIPIPSPSVASATSGLKPNGNGNGKGKEREVVPGSPIKVKDFATLAPIDTDTSPPPMPEDVFLSEPESTVVTPRTESSNPLQSFGEAVKPEQLEQVDAELAKTAEADEAEEAKAEKADTADKVDKIDKVEKVGEVVKVDEVEKASEGGPAPAEPSSSKPQPSKSASAPQPAEHSTPVATTAESTTSSPPSPASPKSPFGGAVPFIQPRIKRTSEPTSPTTAPNTVTPATAPPAAASGIAPPASAPPATQPVDIPSATSPISPAMDSDEERKTAGSP